MIHIMLSVWSISFYPNHVTHIIRSITCDPFHFIHFTWFMWIWPLSYGPCHMILTIWSIPFDLSQMILCTSFLSYDPYVIHIIWSISYDTYALDPYHMINIIRFVSHETYHVILIIWRRSCVHRIWPMSYGPYRMIHTISSLAHVPYYLIPIIWLRC